MSAHYAAPGAEGSSQGFIVKCALTFGVVGVRPPFIYPRERKNRERQRSAHLCRAPPAAPRSEGERSFQMSWGLCHTSRCPRIRFQYAECDSEMFCCDACSKT